MSLQRYQKATEGTSPRRATPNLIAFKAPATGTISRVDIYLGSTPSAGTAIFNLLVAGVGAWALIDRPSIAAGSTSASKTGLAIAVTRGDDIVLDLTQSSTPTTPAPITLTVEIDDGVIGDPIDLNDLTDVTITSAADGDFLQRVAGEFVNRTIAQVLTSLGLADAQTFKGATDCSANPNYPAANAGDTYKVSVAGKIGGASGVVVEAGDIFFCTTDGSAAGNQATVGSNWVVIQSNLDGAVTGAASSTSGNVATFNGTSGKVIQDGGKALPSGAIAGTSDTQTFTNKRITARVGTTASSATPTPDADAHDLFTVTALAAGATFAAPTGTPTDGQPLMLRIKDNGTARTLAFNAIYRAVGVTLPTTTVISKTIYIGCVYNSADTKWDVVGVASEA